MEFQPKIGRQPTEPKKEEPKKSSAVGRLARTAFLGTVLAVSSVEAQAQDVNINIIPKNLTEMMNYAKENTSSFFFRVTQEQEFFTSPKDRENLLKAIKYAQDVALENDPGGLIHTMCINKDNKDIFDQSKFKKAFDICIERKNFSDILKEDNLKDFPEMKPYIAKAVEQALDIVKTRQKNDFTGSIGLQVGFDLYQDEPYAEATLNILGEKASPALTELGSKLVKKPYGFDVLKKVLKEDPFSVRSLKLDGPVPPELEEDVRIAINQVLLEHEVTNYLTPEQYESLQGGREIFNRSMVVLGGKSPSSLLQELEEYDSTWVGDVIRDKALEVALDTIIDNSTWRTISDFNMRYAHLFANTDVGERYITSFGSKNPAGVMDSLHLLPEARYKNLVSNLMDSVISKSDFVFFRISPEDLKRFYNEEEIDSLILNASTNFIDSNEAGELSGFIRVAEKLAGRSYEKDLMKKAVLKDPTILSNLPQEQWQFMSSESDPKLQSVARLASIITEMSQGDIKYKQEQGDTLPGGFSSWENFEAKHKENQLDAGLTFVDYFVANDTSTENMQSVFSFQTTIEAESWTIKNGPPAFKKKSEYMLQELMSGITQRMNAAHDSSDAVRFREVENFSPKQLYLVMTYGEQEIYTSSFNKTFDRMVAGLKKTNESGYKLLADNDFAKFRVFFRECAEYNRMDEFLATMSIEESDALIEQFVSDLGSDTKGQLAEAVSIAEAIPIIKSPKVRETIGRSLSKHIKESRDKNNKSQEVIFSMLGSLYENVTADPDTLLENVSKEFPIKTLDQISVEKLKNPDGTNVQRYYFYNDGDGMYSFQHFLKEYQNDPNYQINDKGSHIVITSLRGGHISIYANKPTNEDDGNNSIDSTLNKLGKDVNIAVHRGHSFHVGKTIKKLTGSAALVSLGGCGGYRVLSQVLEKNAQAQVLSTKGTGTMMINDPAFKKITETIRQGKDIVWSPFWEEMKSKYGKDPRFKDYVSPDKNLGLILMATYREKMNLPVEDHDNE